ncbi:MAG: hypothetical protein IH600_12495 [Bacteroidetes bacterium]|nr:hypothetical protein [Bacteroidota bacterium]
MRVATFVRSHMPAVFFLAAFLLLPAVTSAQFDVGSLKKKAEKAAKSVSGDKEQKTEQEADGDSDMPSAVSSDAVSGNASDVIRDARYAIEPLGSMRSVHQGMFSKKNEAQNFYDKCKKADYENLRAKVKAAVAADPSAMERDQYGYDEVMVTFPEHFAGLTKEYLIPEINNAIEVAYAEKGKGASHAGAALEAAESAVLVADGILLVTPNNTEVQTLRGDAQSAAASMGAAHDAVYASGFNKEHAGEIVFSSQPVVVGSENASALKTTFTANDDIYGMMYFKGTFKEITGGSSYAWTKLFVDGNEKASYDFKLDGDKAERTWLASEIIPDPSLSQTRGAMIFTKAISELSPRRHTIRVQTLDNSMIVLAEGEFQLDCTGGLDRVAEVNKKLGDKKMAAVKLPQPAMRNAALEKEFMAALKEWKETPLKVVITEADWTIQHHPVTGAITSRTINTTVAVKKPDGGCRMFEISFRQQYQGKKYGKAEQYGVGDSADMPCENVK